MIMSDLSPPKGWHVLRFIIEAKSPISCATGTEGVSDIQLARDANGLPIIPGSTLQGVFKSFCDVSTANEYFGYFGQDIDAGEAEDTAHPARLFFSNAHVLGANGHCAEPNTPLSKLKADTIFEHLLEEAPLNRDHVKINQRGVVDGSQKYDRASVPRGTRFAFEVMMIGTQDEQAALVALFGPFINPFFRLGGRGRRGYGRVELRAAKHGFFLPSASHHFRELRCSKLSVLNALSHDVGATIKSVEHYALSITATLTNINPWRSGQDGVRTRTNKRQGKNESIGSPRPDDTKMAATREVWIEWTNEGKGSWCVPTTDKLDGYVLAGTGLAGPLSHRTLFHFNRLSKFFVDAEAEDQAAELERLKTYLANQTNLKHLFGEAADDQDEKSEGLASALFVDDTRLTVKSVMAVDHNSIDRFTGGTRQGALYSEEVIVKSDLNVLIHIDTSRWIMPDDGLAKEAFCLALMDLCEGRLSLGAKGNGFFTLTDPAKPPVLNGKSECDWQTQFKDIQGTSVVPELVS